MPLTPDDVNNVVFQTSKKRNAGYDEDEVDAFLDQVAAELTRLTAENDSLRAQLAARPARWCCACRCSGCGPGRCCAGTFVGRRAGSPRARCGRTHR